ncbi:MAG: PVC-type heme-binding CxxCH protein [Isosphaeraceae bacterium]
MLNCNLFPAALAAALLAADGPRTPPGLPPEEAMRAVKVDPGLKLELVAAEPQVQSPVAMCFDEDGRLWVVEMLDYPNGPAPGSPPEGRIKVLDDRDGDGRYETASVFAEKLLFANGILPWKGGLIVTQAPNILYLRDDDGDGKADRREVLFEGFTAGNPQLRVSHPAVGLDGWVYVANGLRSGSARRAGKPDAKPFELGGRDFRFDLAHDRAEAVAGMGQYGNTFDDWNHRFVCTNRNHLVPIVLEDRYARRNPFMPPPGARTDNQSAGGAARIFPLSSNRTTSTLHTGTFSAACGVTVYRGTLLPEAYRGCAFTCDPTGNVVHQEAIEPDGAGFKGRRVREGVEFLASPSDRFRPVFLAHGPDGALYVVDMNRAVIEHPDFMPAEERSRPDLTVGKDTGRIYRVVPENSAGTKSSRPKLSAASTAELVATLEHPDAWWRVTAQRLLLGRDDPSARGPLRSLALNSKKPEARALAAWLLEQAGALDEPVVASLLSSPNARLREQGVLLAESRLNASAGLRDHVITLASDPDDRVRFQVALSLGVWDDDRVLLPLAKVAIAGSGDRWTRMAVATAVPTRAGALLQALLKPGAGLAARRDSGGPELVAEFAALVGARRDPAEVAATLDALLAFDAPDAPRWQFAGLSGLADGMGRRGGRLGEVLAALPSPGGKEVSTRIAALFTRAAAVAADTGATLDDRTAAVRLLAQAPWEVAGPALEPLLGEDPSQEVRIAAARSLAAQARPEVAAVLLAPWRSYTPAVRREAAAALAARPERAAALLDAVEAGKVAARELDAALARQLTSGGRPEVRQRAAKLLAAAVPEARKPVLERFHRALSTPADPARGREVFRKTCATCHSVGGIGVQVGPDITDTRVKTPEQLLGDILNPNAAIDGNYATYTVATRDGRVLTGIIAAESAASLTLKRAEGQTDTVLRSDVEAIRSEGVSLMPEGIERDISVEQMADLIRFLKTWRDLDPPARPK